MKKTITTKEEAKPALTPKLRFPEFRAVDGWESEKVDDLVDTVTPPKKLPTSNYSPKGAFPIIDQSQADICGWTDDDEALIQDGLPLIVFGDHTCILKLIDRPFAQGADGIKILKSRPKVGNRYLYQFLSYRPVVTEEYKRHYSILKEKLVFFPDFQTGEQQKIAECLSSVDELIGAESRKLDALKDHKKGLMQQLFPGTPTSSSAWKKNADEDVGAPSETQPRLRFPEFQNAGEWEIRTIGEMFSLINGCAFKPEDWKPTGTPIIRIQNLNDPSAEFNYSQEPVPERNRVESGDLLFAWSGTLGSSFGARIWNGPSGVLNQHIFKVLMDEQQITLQFALLVLARVEEEIARRTHGFKASFVHVKKADLVQVEMLLPSIPEQQCIADCLSSLDDLIVAQTQKLATLKTHKKGLMQQLFLSPEEVEA